MTSRQSKHPFAVYVAGAVAVAVSVLEQGLIRLGPDSVEADVYVVTQGGNAMVYVTDPDNRARLRPRLTKLLAGLEGVDRVIQASEYGRLGLPIPSENGAVGDLMLFAKDGYWFGDAHDGPRGRQFSGLGGLGDGPGELQTLLVASPRNHLYLHEVVVIRRPRAVPQQSSESRWLARALGFGALRMAARLPCRLDSELSPSGVSVMESTRPRRCSTDDIAVR